MLPQDFTGDFGKFALFGPGGRRLLPKPVQFPPPGFVQPAAIHLAQLNCGPRRVQQPQGVARGLHAQLRRTPVAFPTKPRPVQVHPRSPLQFGGEHSQQQVGGRVVRQRQQPLVMVGAGQRLYPPRQLPGPLGGFLPGDLDFPQQSSAHRRLAPFGEGEGAVEIKPFQGLFEFWTADIGHDPPRLPPSRLRSVRRSG